MDDWNPLRCEHCIAVCQYNIKFDTTDFQDSSSTFSCWMPGGRKIASAISVFRPPCKIEGVIPRTKTDSETTPDSETRDSETGRRIQKINVVFRNYFVVFKNYCVGFGSYPWYSATIRSIQKPFRRIQKRNVVFRNNFVVFKNYFVGFRHNPWYSETIRSIRELFSSDSETARVE